MKKQYCFCRTALLLCAWLFSSAAWAYDFVVDGIYYNITSSQTVEVTYKSFSGGYYSSDYSGDVTIPEMVTYGDVEYRVTAIGDCAFENCTGLTSVTIPESVTFIGQEAFLSCWGLTSVTIPESVKSIGQQAFWACSKLKSVTIPEGVKSIYGAAFAYCGLTSISIPESVTYIVFRAFGNCSHLTSVTVYNPTPVDITYDVFQHTNCANCKLYVPKGSVEAYRNAEGWKEFGTILPIDESSAITEIRQDNADGHVTVYNLQGVLVLETDDAADLKTLQNGAYIVNGKKMIIAR